MCNVMYALLHHTLHLRYFVVVTAIICDVVAAAVVGAAFVICIVVDYDTICILV